jgi:hypothetical protein
VSLCFESLSAASVYMAPRSRLMLYLLGRTSGIVVDGEDAVPIYEGCVLPHAVRRLSGNSANDIASAVKAAVAALDADLKHPGEMLECRHLRAWNAERPIRGIGRRRAGRAAGICGRTLGRQLGLHRKVAQRRGLAAHCSHNWIPAQECGSVAPNLTMRARRSCTESASDQPRGRR